MDFKKNIRYRAALDLHFFGRKLAKIHSDVGCFCRTIIVGKFKRGSGLKNILNWHLITRYCFEEYRNCKQDYLYKNILQYLFNN
jgi:hypothetical protein